MLKKDWDPLKHPRWPAGSPDSIGGEFAPADTADDPLPGEPKASIIPAEFTIPVPFDLVVPRRLPFPLPQEIVPPLGIYPRHRLENPYPDREGCDEEWEYAKEYCQRLSERGLLGKGDYREHGKAFLQCVLGQVSERCGGSPHA